MSRERYSCYNGFIIKDQRNTSGPFYRGLRGHSLYEVNLLGGTATLEKLRGGCPPRAGACGEDTAVELD